MPRREAISATLLLSFRLRVPPGELQLLTFSKLLELIDLFAAGLGLPDPWRITASEVKDPEGAGFGELHLTVEVAPESRFPFPGDASGERLPVHDTVEKTLQHLPFLQYRTFIHFQVPRVMNAEGRIAEVELPDLPAAPSATADFGAFMGF